MPATAFQPTRASATLGAGVGLGIADTTGETNRLKGLMGRWALCTDLWPRA